MSDALVDLVVRAWCGVRDDLTWQRTTDPSEREWLRGKAHAVLTALAPQIRAQAYRDAASIAETFEDGPAAAKALAWMAGEEER